MSLAILVKLPGAISMRVRARFIVISAAMSLPALFLWNLGCADDSAPVTQSHPLADVDTFVVVLRTSDCVAWTTQYVTCDSTYWDVYDVPIVADTTVQISTPGYQVRRLNLPLLDDPSEMRIRFSTFTASFDKTRWSDSQLEYSIPTNALSARLEFTWIEGDPLYQGTGYLASLRAETPTIWIGGRDTDSFFLVGQIVYERITDNPGGWYDKEFPR